jgi:iron complex outermembrane receptor protein
VQTRHDNRQQVEEVMHDARSLIGLCIALVAGPVLPAATPVADLADLTLEQLSNIEVTSVSRRAERLSDAPASIYVITSDDIRRSGVQSLPEALRLAPNLQVARTSASGYAITARGFNNAIGNKLLVLIDGRTVYTPLFSGVFWDAQHVVLDDVERIEVISGPGATLWGANAVNGVINVITRPARDTQGLLANVGAGTNRVGAVARYGGKVGADGSYRVYAGGFERDNTELADGTPVRDGWSKGQAGFRADWNGVDRSATLQGDLYRGDLEQAAPGKTKIEGANIVARWNQLLPGGSELRLQTYFDYTMRDQPGVFKEHLNILDLEAQYAVRQTGPHKLLWGAGYRYASDRVENSPGLAFLPADKSLKWANVFVQDEIELAKGLELTLGVKAESNTYTGWDFLPSARIAWKPSDGQLVWGALSRAVRAPSRLDRELFVPGAPPFLLAGGPSFRSEISNVIELGYRARPSAGWSYSVAAFYDDYDRLRSFEPAPGGVFVIDNKIEGTTHGLEAWTTYQFSKTVRLSGGLVLLKENLRLKADSRDPNGVSALGNDPSHQWLLRASVDLSPRHELDVIVRHIGALPNPIVPSYTAVDARLGWRVSHEFDVSLTVQNLFDPSHPEFGAAATRSESERAVFLKLQWRL